MVHKKSYSVSCNKNTTIPWKLRKKIKQMLDKYEQMFYDESIQNICSLKKRRLSNGKRRKIKSVGCGNQPY